MKPATITDNPLPSKHTHPACFRSLTHVQPTALLKATLLAAVMAALTGCCQPNDPSCRNISFGPSGAEVVGVAVGAGAVVATLVAVEVHHAHHTINGCTSNGPSGIQLQTSGGAKTYLLSGNTAHITAGEHVRLHGAKVKPSRHSNIDPTFLVERENKDYGPCKLNPSQAATP